MDCTAIAALKKALEAAGAKAKLVAARVGKLHPASGEALTIDFSLQAHCRLGGRRAAAESRRLRRRGDYHNRRDGVIISLQEQAAPAEALIKAMARHRFWSREMKARPKA